MLRPLLLDEPFCWHCHCDQCAGARLVMVENRAYTGNDFLFPQLTQGGQNSLLAHTQFLRHVGIGIFTEGKSALVVIQQLSGQYCHHKPISWARRVKKIPLGFCAGSCAIRSSVRVS